MLCYHWWALGKPSPHPLASAASLDADYVHMGVMNRMPFSSFSFPIYLLVRLGSLILKAFTQEGITWPNRYCVASSNSEQGRKPQAPWKPRSLPN